MNNRMTPGGSPLVKLENISSELNAEIYAKLEFYNPTGSVKDRIAHAMIEAGEKDGQIQPETVIIEPTSGNTGIGLASVCAMKNYRLILTMPETMSIERRHVLAHGGAELVLTDGAKGMKGAIDKANELAQEIGNAYIPMQFSNPANPKIHETTTGPEIWNEMAGDFDIFIAGVGTGGTITGCSRFFKTKKNILTVAIEPEASPIISKGVAGKHKIQGIGAGFIPDNFDRKLVDEIFLVSDEDAFKYMKLAAQKDGIHCGISAGAALATAISYAGKPEHKGKKIVVIFPDALDRYLSMIINI